MSELSRLTTTDFDAIDARVAVVPTGSTEQHGPALPLGTDAIIASDLAGAVADRPEVVLGPIIPIGVSPHHRHFGGTLWVTESTFRRYVEEVTRSLASHGIGRVILVNGHGGNVAALTRLGQRLRAEELAFAVTWNWWGAVNDQLEELFETPGGHACHGETSMLYAVDAETVRDDRLADAEAGAPPGCGCRIHGAEIGFDTIDFTPTGAVGRPTAGSPEAGERLHAACLAELNALVDWLVDRPSDVLFELARPLHPDE